jgi:hypothetical protein
MPLLGRIGHEKRRYSRRTLRRNSLSHVFAGQNVGVTRVGERVWLVTFMR